MKTGFYLKGKAILASLRTQYNVALSLLSVWLRKRTPVAGQIQVFTVVHVHCYLTVLSRGRVRKLLQLFILGICFEERAFSFNFQLETWKFWFNLKHIKEKHRQKTCYRIIGGFYFHFHSFQIVLIWYRFYLDLLLLLLPFAAYHSLLLSSFLDVF